MSEQAAAVLGAINAMSSNLPKPTGEESPKTEANTEAPKEDPKVSSKLAVLMQREKAALERERIAKSRESELEIKSKAFLEREAKIQEFERLKETNPMKALELLGLNYQDLTQVALADGNLTPDIQIKKVNDKLDNFLKSQEADKERVARDAKTAEEARLAETTTKFKGEINTFIEDNKAKYQLIDFEGQTDLVYDVIDEHYGRTIDKATGVGQVMKIADAADKVEAWLEKRNDERSNLDKVKAKLVPQPARYVVEKPEVKYPVQKQMRTLNNQQSATPSRPPSKLLTDDERIARAIAYARGLRP